MRGRCGFAGVWGGEWVLLIESHKSLRWEIRGSALLRTRLGWRESGLDRGKS